MNRQQDNEDAEKHHRADLGGCATGVTSKRHDQPSINVLTDMEASELSGTWLISYSRGSNGELLADDSVIRYVVHLWVWHS